MITGNPSQSSFVFESLFFESEESGEGSVALMMEFCGNAGSLGQELIANLNGMQTVNCWFAE
jgi:hypothetical protein